MTFRGEKMIAINRSETDVTLPDGYSMRPATFDDVEISADFINAYYQAVIGEDDTNPDALRGEWQSPRFTPEHGVRLIFDAQGKIAAFGSFHDTNEPLVRMFGSAFVPPNAEDRGLHDVLIAWIMNSAAEALPRSPEGTRVVLHMEVMQKD